MSNKKFNREKIPSFTYVKEFGDSEFSVGFRELINLIPDIRMYAGKEDKYENVISNLLNTIKESIPSPLNPNFPNTMSFSINSKEVGFLTDDQLAFGWKIFLSKNSESMTFQFRITFLSLSISKRKYIDLLLENGWKEKDLSDKQSRFWNEIHTNSRPSYKAGSSSKVTNNKMPAKPKISKHVPKVQNEIKEIDNTENNNNNIVQENTQPIKKDETVVVQTNNDITINKHPESPLKPITQQVKMTDDNDYIAPSQDISTCAIYPSENKATFRIIHFGNEFMYNINDRQQGIFVDRNSYIIKIDNVIYNYKTFHVDQLPEDYEIERSTYVPGNENMNNYGPVDDSVFVPQSVIMKANNPELKPSETIVANNKKNQSNNFIPQIKSQSSIPIIANNVKKPALILNSKPQISEIPQASQVSQQMVRMTDN